MVLRIMRRLLRNERGAGTLEYALIGAALLVIILAGFNILKGSFTGAMQNTGNKLIDQSNNSGPLVGN